MDRVLELGGYSAAFCGRLFAQSGYEVVRVEPPVPPPAWVSQTAMDLYLHPGKRRVRTDDRGLIAELAARADVVVVEAEGADAVDELGFDNWQTPVKTAITPFGRTGPKRNWRATPHVLLAMGGYTNLMGDPDRAPLSLPGHYVEFQSGGFAFTAANACRIAGEPNTIDIGMLEVVMALSQFTTVMWHCGGVVRSRHGSDFWSVVPTNLFRCADGWLYINIVPSFWDAFTVFLGQPELLVDERFATNEKRMQKPRRPARAHCRRGDHADQSRDTAASGRLPGSDRRGAVVRQRPGRRPPRRTRRLANSGEPDDERALATTGMAHPRRTPAAARPVRSGDPVTWLTGLCAAFASWT